MADLPGPKIRIGHLTREPVELERGQPFILQTRETEGDAHRVSVLAGRHHHLTRGCVHTWLSHIHRDTFRQHDLWRADAAGCGSLAQHGDVPQ